VAPFVVGRAELAQGRVAPAWVVEAFEVVEDGHPRLGPGAEAVAVESSHSRVAKKLSAMALSKQSPTDNWSGGTLAMLSGLSSDRQ